MAPRGITAEARRILRNEANRNEECAYHESGIGSHVVKPSAPSRQRFAPNCDGGESCTTLILSLARSNWSKSRSMSSPNLSQ